ncbi:MAG: hypothetical protein B7X58_09350 [Marinobacter sp. 34-60-7]|nr:MAG: hypothetical protein B7X58_09350 [Marinobacter sp. 34-60-7]
MPSLPPWVPGTAWWPWKSMASPGAPRPSPVSWRTGSRPAMMSVSWWVVLMVCPSAVASGRINGEAVVFLLDTGATDVAIPAELAEKLGLARGAPILLQTANGQTTGYRTVLDSLSLGDIVLRDVRAIVAPGFDGEQILLGMSALKQLEFTQRAGTLVLRQHATDRP